MPSSQPKNSRPLPQTHDMVQRVGFAPGRDELGEGRARVKTGREESRRPTRTEPEIPPADMGAGSTFRTDIEGLRAVAVLAVVLFHAGIPGFTGGFVGVDVFFIISGFLITGVLWREASTSGTVSLRRFWGARARRLLPASAVVGVITMIVSALTLSPLQVKTVAIDAITSALYVSNYWFIASGLNYFGKDNLVTPSPFKHYWSLGVEEQFYLVWPVMIIAAAWLLRRLQRGREISGAPPSAGPYTVLLALVVVVSFPLSLVLTYIMPPAAYLSLPTRAWQLAIGGLVALTALHWRRLPPLPAALLGWVGLAMILLSCIWLNATTEYPGTAALLPTLGTALVIGAGCATGAQGCGRLLKPFTHEGDRADFVFVVSVALARVGPAPRSAGSPTGLASETGCDGSLGRSGDVDPAIHREPVAILRSHPPISAQQLGAWRRRYRDGGRCGGHYVGGSTISGWPRTGRAALGDQRRAHASRLANGGV